MGKEGGGGEWIVIVILLGYFEYYFIAYYDCMYVCIYMKKWINIDLFEVISLLKSCYNLLSIG